MRSLRASSAIRRRHRWNPWAGTIGSGHGWNKAANYLLMVVLAVMLVYATGRWSLAVTMVALLLVTFLMGRMSVMYPRVPRYGVRMRVRAELLAPDRTAQPSRCLGDFHTQAEAQSFIEDQWARGHAEGWNAANPEEVPFTWEVFDHAEERRMRAAHFRAVLEAAKAAQKSDRRARGK